MNDYNSGNKKSMSDCRIYPDVKSLLTKKPDPVDIGQRAL